MNRKSLGFSLAEMMIVMLILSIVLAAATPIITHRVIASANEETQNANILVGIINSFSGTEIPEGWLLCDGKSYSISGTYADLFSVIGYRYGGSGYNFNVPDLRGRAPIGMDNMGGTSANIVTAAVADTLGGKAGEEVHLLTIAEMPAHSHSGYTDSQGSHTHYIGAVGTWGSSWGFSDRNNAGSSSYNYATGWAGEHAHNVYTYGVGGSTTHNNMQPYIALNYIIKY